MAERIFAHELKERGLKGMAISMGTLGLQGRSAARNAVAALAEVDIDLSAHRSQGLSAGILGHASDLFVMERMHRDKIIAAAPQTRPRIVFLGDFDPLGGTSQIDDPVGQDLDAFRECRDRIQRCVGAWLDARAGAVSAS